MIYTYDEYQKYISATYKFVDYLLSFYPLEVDAAADEEMPSVEDQHQAWGLPGCKAK